MTSRRARRRGWRLALYLAAALVLLGLAERGARMLVSRRVLATAGAQWIWAEGALEKSEPLAFYAVRDFELGAPPARASIHVLADEAYVLFVNEKRVGSGAYFAGAPLDTYRLDSLLRPGWNRVAIELRSGRGAGGLLCALFADGERDPMRRERSRAGASTATPPASLDGMRPRATASRRWCGNRRRPAAGASRASGPSGRATTRSCWRTEAPASSRRRWRRAPSRGRPRSSARRWSTTSAGR